jgi:hypothetical protein
MWSDTGSAVYQSKGDVVKRVNLDARNITGPVKGSRHLEASTLKVPPQHYSMRSDS